MKVVESKEIEEGAHTGVTTKLERREQDYKGKKISYFDLYVKLDGDERELKTGCAISTDKDGEDVVSSKGKLGKLLVNFGANLKVGQNIEPKNILEGKKVKFMTMNETTERGTFARIVDGSLRMV